jgi:hypothetical protein
MCQSKSVRGGGGKGEEEECGAVGGAVGLLLLGQAMRNCRSRLERLSKIKKASISAGRKIANDLLNVRPSYR